MGGFGVRSCGGDRIQLTAVSYSKLTGSPVTLATEYKDHSYHCTVAEGLLTPDFLQASKMVLPVDCLQ